MCIRDSLRLALGGLGVLGEDVQDQRGPVDDLDLDDVLQRAPLAGAQFVVAHDSVGAVLDDDVAQLLGLAGPEIGGRIGPLAPLHNSSKNHGARSLG